MDENTKFDYYYGIEADQFSFYRVPRLLIKDERFKGLSSDAKLLYGLMLDRMSLSMKNGWLDEENRAYIIYTVDAIMEDLGCAKATCVKIMKELDSEKGIGLIEKKRRGLGKPDIIYVKNFATMSAEQDVKEPENTGKSTEVQNLNFKNHCYPIMTKRMSLTLKNTSRTATDSALRGMMWWMRYAMSEKSQLNFWTSKRFLIPCCLSRISCSIRM